MAKSEIVTNEDGIFPRRIVVLGDESDRIDVRRPSLQESLAAWRRDCNAILTYLLPSPRPADAVGVLRFNSVHRAPGFRPPEPSWYREFRQAAAEHDIELAFDAANCIARIDAMLMHLTSDFSRGHVARIGIQVGMLVARIQARRFEPHAKRGRKVRDAASKGGRARNAEHAAKRAQYQADVEAAMAANRRVSFTEARRLVAKRHGVSFETVKNHTEKPPSKKVKK